MYPISLARQCAELETVARADGRGLDRGDGPASLNRERAVENERLGDALASIHHGHPWAKRSR